MLCLHYSSPSNSHGKLPSASSSSSSANRARVTPAGSRNGNGNDKEVAHLHNKIDKLENLVMSLAEKLPSPTVSNTVSAVTPKGCRSCKQPLAAGPFCSFCGTKNR